MIVHIKGINLSSSGLKTKWTVEKTVQQITNLQNWHNIHATDN